MLYSYGIQKSALKFTAPFALAIKKKFQIALKATTSKVTLPLQITWTSRTDKPTKAFYSKSFTATKPVSYTHLRAHET